MGFTADSRSTAAVGRGAFSRDRWRDSRFLHYRAAPRGRRRWSAGSAGVISAREALEVAVVVTNTMRVIGRARPLVHVDRESPLARHRDDAMPTRRDTTRTGRALSRCVIVTAHQSARCAARPQHHRSHAPAGEEAFRYVPKGGQVMNSRGQTKQNIATHAHAMRYGSWTGALRNFLI
jgi:hypothetical protein